MSSKVQEIFSQQPDGFMVRPAMTVIDDALRHSGGTSVSTSESADILRVTAAALNGTRLGTLNPDVD